MTSVDDQRDELSDVFIGDELSGGPDVKGRIDSVQLDPEHNVRRLLIATL